MASDYEEKKAEKTKKANAEKKATEEKIRGMTPEEQRKALREKIKKDSTSVKLVTQG